MKRRYHIVLPLIVTLIIGSIVLVSLPDFFHPYILTVEDKIGKQGSGESRIYFFDMDQDGTTEELHYHETTPGIPSIKITSPNDEDFHQHSGAGEFVIRSHPLIFDYDHDNNYEYFFPFVLNDSLFLTGNTYSDNVYKLKKRYFLSKIKRLEGTLDFGVTSGSCYDLNGDGFDEYLFSVASGFTLKPREIMALDLHNDIIYKSETLGPPMARPVIFDIGGDGSIDIIPSISMPNNLPDTVRYPDQYPWFFQFDSTLQIKKPGIKFVDGNRNFLPHKITRNDSSFLFIITENGRKPIDSIYHITDSKGEIIKSASYPMKVNFIRYNRIMVLMDRLLFSSDKNDIYNIDQDLNFQLIADLPGEKEFFMPVDLSGDGVEEFISLNYERDKITVWESNFANPVSMYFQSRISFQYDYGIKIIDGTYSFLVTDEYFQWVISRQENPYHYLKYPFIIGIYLLVFGLIVLFIKIRQWRISSYEKVLLELQLKNFKEQFDTHFTFNVLNSIGAVIMEEKKEEAYDMFNDFSLFLRQVFQHSETNYTTLEQDIDYAKTYLKLQKYRFKEKLTYSIEVNNHVDIQQKVPKLMLHSFVENALKHGIMNRKEGGNIDIIASSKGFLTTITIEDDGVGLRNTGKTTGLGKGLKLLGNYFKMFKKLYGIGIEYTLSEGKDGKGVKAIIKISRLK